MAKIEDFADSKEYEKQINEAFLKGYHLQWITLISSLLEQFMSVIMYLRVPAQERLDTNAVNFVKRLSSYNKMNILYLDGIINKDLYNKIDFFQSKRNTIIHSFILKNEKLDDLDLKEYFDKGKSAFEELVVSLMQFMKMKQITEEISAEVFEKLKLNSKEPV